MQINPFQSSLPSAQRPAPRTPPSSPAFNDVFQPTGVVLTGAGMALGGLSALRLAAAMPAQVQTAVGIAGALVGGAIGLATGVPAGRAMQVAVSDPSWGHSAQSGAWLGGALGLLGAGALLTGSGAAAPALTDLAIVVAGGAGLGALSASLVHGQHEVRRHILG